MSNMVRVKNRDLRRSSIRVSSSCTTYDTHTGTHGRWSIKLSKVKGTTLRTAESVPSKGHYDFHSFPVDD